MKESISSRIRRIIAGTANSIVEKIEGLAPEAVLKEAIREVDSAIDEVRAEMGNTTSPRPSASSTKAWADLRPARKDLLELAVSHLTSKTSSRL